MKYEDQSEKPAFPCVISEHDGSICVSGSGLTKREYFALHLMVANRAAFLGTPEMLVEKALADTDALLKALAETEPKP